MKQRACRHHVHSHGAHHWPNLSLSAAQRHAIRRCRQASASPTAQIATTAPSVPKPPPQPSLLSGTPKGKAKPGPLAAGLLPCMAYVVAYHAACIGALLAWHLQSHGVVNLTHALLATFLVINVWICICEIALLCFPSPIQQQGAAFDARHGAGVLPPVFLFERVALRDVLSLRYWAIMWSTYAQLDPAYVDTTSFGYCVDVGNGVTTLLPSLLFAAGMTNHALFAPRVLGMLGLVPFYQELYGTCVYFFQYCFNRKYSLTSRAMVYGVVLPANGIWIAFPLIGMWASARLILDDSYAVFL